MMSKLFKLLILLCIVSCIDNDKNYVSINGETDRVGDAILLKIDPSGNQIDTTSIKKININRVEMNEFRKHPYNQL